MRGPRRVAMCRRCHDPYAHTSRAREVKEAAPGCCGSGTWPGGRESPRRRCASTRARGLVEPDGRVAGQRRYGEAAVERLRMVVLLRKAGLSCDDIAVALNPTPEG